MLTETEGGKEEGGVVGDTERKREGRMSRKESDVL